MILPRLLLLTVEMAVHGMWLRAVEWQAALLNVWSRSLRARVDQAYKEIP